MSLKFDTTAAAEFLKEYEIQGLSGAVSAAHKAVHEKQEPETTF